MFAALVVVAALGKLPPGSDFGRYSGLPAIGVVAVVVIVVLGALGEETGSRGFALPLLQRRYGALAAALLVTPIWAVWHLPFFFSLRPTVVSLRSVTSASSSVCAPRVAYLHNGEPRVFR